MKTVYLKIVLNTEDDRGPNQLAVALERVATFLEVECGDTVRSITRVTLFEITDAPAPAPAGIPRHHLDDMDAGKERLLESVDEEMDIHEVAQAYSWFIDRDHVITVENSDAYYRGLPVVLGI